MPAYVPAGGPSRELADALVLERWRLYAAGPYMLQGWVGMNLKSGVAFAFDTGAGWARFIDRWVRLGAPARAQPLPSNDAVMRCAMAEHARGSGFDLAAYLLDMAALEADAARFPDQREHIGDRVAALHQRGRDRKAKRARYRSF